jgi:hypothetical protein
MKWLLAIVGGLVALGAIGATVTPTSSIDYAEATDEERTVWLQERGDEIGRGVSDGLKAAGMNHAQMALSSKEYDPDRKEITFAIEVKGSVRMGFPNNFSIQFQDQMCPVFRRSGLAKEGIRTTFKIVRSNGDVVRSDTISASVCDRLDAFKARRQS